MIYLQLPFPVPAGLMQVLLQALETQFRLRTLDGGLLVDIYRDSHYSLSKLGVVWDYLMNFLPQLLWQVLTTYHVLC